MKNSIRTDRLILRQWSEEDLEPFAKLNADPKVREYFPCVLTTEQSNDSVVYMSEHIEKYGWGLWSTCLIETGECIGFIGLQHITFQADFVPAVEIGWRLACKHWGKGYATEGALACLSYGFDTIELNEIVSITAVHNERSRAVMQRIGMHHDLRGDFDHPRVPEGHPVRRHVLYRLQADEYAKRKA